MTEHPDAVAYRRTADAFRSGDLQTVKTMVAPEVVWHVPGEHPMAGVINGREALLTWLAELPSLNKNRAGNRRPALAPSPSDESPDAVSAVDGR